MLEGEGFEICAEETDARCAVRAALRERPELCLLDVKIAGGGIAAAGEIAAHLPHAAIVMFTVLRDEVHLVEALRAGASGYLLKDMDPNRLPVVLRRVLAGELAVPRSLVAPLVDELRVRTRIRRPLPNHPEIELTPRECDVLELLRDGFTSAEMAERLSISQVTVRRHISKVLKKLDVADRRSAVRLIEPTEA
jgi:DNA-binding NarL/FixJ family response regulator